LTFKTDIQKSPGTLDIFIFTVQGHRPKLVGKTSKQTFVQSKKVQVSDSFGIWVCAKQGGHHWPKKSKKYTEVQRTLVYSLESG
jgi:hypothetical protein